MEDATRVFPVIQSASYPIIRFHFSVVAARPRVTKNPQPLPAVGFVKVLRLTSASGVANYDDYQNDSLGDVFQHCAANLFKKPVRSSAKSTPSPARVHLDTVLAGRNGTVSAKPIRFKARGILSKVCRNRFQN